MKTCAVCKAAKPLDAFNLSRKAKDGRHSWCRECRAADYAAHRDDVLAGMRGYAAKNRARILPRQAEWRRQNRERLAAMQARYRAENPAKVNADAAARRAQRLRATPPWLSAAHRAQMTALYEAARAGKELLGEGLHVDHIVPLKAANACGLHVPWNLRLSDAASNLRKGNRMEAEQ